MAQGKLVQGEGKSSPLLTVDAYLRKRMQAGSIPACVRTRKETFPDAPATVLGVPVVYDARVQPGCFLFCDGGEP